MAAPARDDYNLEMKDELMGQTPRPEKFSLLYTCGIDEKCSGRKFHRQELEKHVLNSHMAKNPGLFVGHFVSVGPIWAIGFWRASSHSRSEILKDMECRINFYGQIFTRGEGSKAAIEKAISEAHESGIKMNHAVWAEWESKVMLATAEVAPLRHITKYAILERFKEMGITANTGVSIWSGFEHFNRESGQNDEVELPISPIDLEYLLKNDG